MGADRKEFILCLFLGELCELCVKSFFLKALGRELLERAGSVDFTD